MRHRKSLP